MYIYIYIILYYIILYYIIPYNTYIIHNIIMLQVSSRKRKGFHQKRLRRRFESGPLVDFPLVGG